MESGLCCPKGCGPLEYNDQMTNRSYMLAFVGPIIIVIGLIAGSSSISGLGIIMILYAFYATKISLLRCWDCLGAMYESKSLDIFLKNDANYLRTQLFSSQKTSQYNCPECGEKMKLLDLSIRERHPYIEPSGLGILKWILKGKKTMQIDGCCECDMVWFDSDEENELSFGSHKIIRTD